MLLQAEGTIRTIKKESQKEQAQDAAIPPWLKTEASQRHDGEQTKNPRHPPFPSPICRKPTVLTSSLSSTPLPVVESFPVPERAIPAVIPPFFGLCGLKIPC